MLAECREAVDVMLDLVQDFTKLNPVSPAKDDEDGKDGESGEGGTGVSAIDFSSSDPTSLLARAKLLLTLVVPIPGLSLAARLHLLLVIFACLTNLSLDLFGTTWELPRKARLFLSVFANLAMLIGPTIHFLLCLLVSLFLFVFVAIPMSNGLENIGNNRDFIMVSTSLSNCYCVRHTYTHTYTHTHIHTYTHTHIHKHIHHKHLCARSLRKTPFIGGRVYVLLQG